MKDTLATVSPAGIRENFSKPPVLRDAELGPDMRALNPRQRAFVFHLVELGGGAKGNFAEAAALAGYSGDADALRANGTRLAHDERVGRAIVEEARRRIHSSALLAVSELHRILGEPTTSVANRLRAIEMVLNRVGLPTNQTMTVTHEHTLSEKEQIANITSLANRLGLDPQKLLGNSGVVVDGTFTEVVDIPAEEW